MIFLRSPLQAYYYLCYNKNAAAYVVQATLLPYSGVKGWRVKM